MHFGHASSQFRDISKLVFNLFRPDSKVSFGFSLMRGKRASMEDFYTAQVNHRSYLFPQAWPDDNVFLNLYGRVRTASASRQLSEKLWMVPEDLGSTGSACSAPRAVAVALQSLPHSVKTYSQLTLASAALLQFRRSPIYNDHVGLFGVFDGVQPSSTRCSAV